jgi:GrpB-like predicted nucleotidyltransferase (UPF0157 family)
MPSLYTFTEYSPDWPAAFQQEAERIKALFGDELVRVHHIGSTSVPGLAAKPIIDLLPLVRDIAAGADWNEERRGSRVRAKRCNGFCAMPARQSPSARAASTS